MALAGLPHVFVLGITTFIFGNYIDKLDIDEVKGIHTLPGISGEKAARFSVQVMITLTYLLVVGLVVSGFFTPCALTVLTTPYFAQRLGQCSTHPDPPSHTPICSMPGRCGL